MVVYLTYRDEGHRDFKNIVMKSNRMLTLALLLSLLGGCTEDRAYHQAIQGEWVAYKWAVGQEGERDASQVRFRFEEDAYQAALGGQEEQGSFRVEGNKLYTRAGGQQEMMVRIARLSGDTLEFEMNRGGIPERLYLRRL
jgi:hypothetical protein